MVADVFASLLRKTRSLVQQRSCKNAFKKSVKHGCVSRSETIISALTRFDAIISDALDALLVADFMGGHHFEHKQAEEVHSQAAVGVHHNWANRGGTAFLESLEGPIILLPIVAIDLLSDFYYIVRKYCDLSHQRIGTEFSSCGGNSVDERLNNEDRELKVYLKMPDYVHYYIALTAQAFSAHVREWIEKVLDCFILHSASQKTPFQKSKNVTPLLVIFESDEKGADDFVIVIKNRLEYPTMAPNIIDHFESESSECSLKSAGFSIFNEKLIATVDLFFVGKIKLVFLSARHSSSKLALACVRVISQLFEMDNKLF